METYKPDLLYSDSKLPFDEVGRSMLANYYNQSLGWNQGKIDVVMNIKGVGGQFDSFQTNETVLPYVQRALVRSTEASTEPQISADPFQTELDIQSGNWHYLTGGGYTDAATLVIRPGADWRGHVPGQYVRIGVDVDGVRCWRAYSLTHGPRADGRISITVKAVPDGHVSTFLVRHTKPGTLLHLEQAAGEFVLPAPTGAAERRTKLLFVTAGPSVRDMLHRSGGLFAEHAQTGVTTEAARSRPEGFLRHFTRFFLDDVD